MRRLLFLPLIVFIGCVTPSTDNSPDATISENLDATASGGFDSLTYCKAWCQHAVDTSEVVDVTACWQDRKSTRLNSSHQIISYAVFCLKKKNMVCLA